MRIKSSIAVAAMAVALVTPQAVMAKARPTGLTVTEQLQMAQQQMAQMQAQLNALQAKLDQQQSQQASVADVQAANAKATQALAVADAAKASAADASAKASKPAVPDAVKWAADTKISGRMYFNASTISATNGAGTNAEKDGAFQIKRFYVGVDHKFSNVFAGNITVDVDNLVRSKSVTTGTATGDGGTAMGLFVKKAYLEAKLNPAFIVRLGSADLPWIPYVEGINGYRHIEKTITDLDGYGTSADWGVHVLGSFADGLVSYQVSAVDGAGYRDPQLTKTVDLEGRLTLHYKGFDASVGGYTGKLGNDTQANEGLSVFYRTANRFDALLAYKGKVNNVDFTLGGEYFYAKNWKIKTTAAEDSADGYSVFASVSPIKQWSVFGRYDWVKPNRDTAPAKVDHFFNVGVQYSPAKIVDLALVYKRDSGDGGINIGNLTTNTSTQPAHATRDEIGLYGQFRF